MISNFYRHSKLAASLAVLVGAAGLWLGSATIATAQSDFGTSDAFGDLRQDNERDPLLGGSDIDMMDLIHRANLSGGRSLAEFIGAQQTQIESAAADFRSLQLQRIYQGEAIETPSAVSFDLSE